ncbi:hypothetical protein F5B17DRAFT_9619 [Nemania serpens]|nr:hypothetical protein F5B17DRAFT_9619 [Nemania serpens]
MAELPTEHKKHVLKDPACLNQNPKRLSSSAHNDIISPTDRECREHAGEVRRRNDRNVRADPPPPQPAQAMTSNSAKSNQGRKKQSSGLGGGDDSDSDHDSSQHGVGERDEGVIMRKKKQSSSAPNGELRSKSRNAVAGPSTSMSLTPEEEERVQLQRQIARQRETGDGRWHRLLQTRRLIRDSAMQEKRRMSRLLQGSPSIQNHSFGLSGDIFGRNWPNLHVLHLQELRMRQYLDEALCHGITDNDVIEDENCLSEGISRLDLLERAIEQAEKKFVIWWENFVKPKEPTVQAVIEALRTVLYLSSSTLIETLKDEGLMLDPLAFWYERRILHELGFSSGLSYIDIMLQLRSRLPNGLWNRDPEYLNTIEMLSKSRQKTDSGERLSREYIDWVFSGAPPPLIDSCCQQALQQIRGNKLRNMGESVSTAQEFCENSRDGTLALVLLKGGMLVSTKPVSRSDQKLLGWYRMRDELIQTYEGPSDMVRRNIWQSDLTNDALHGKLYRYEIDRQLGYTFKVGLNGEVLGLWTPSVT